jgi:hypothetical protein
MRARRGSSGNAEARDHVQTEARNTESLATDLTVVEPLFMIEMRGGAVW